MLNPGVDLLVDKDCSGCVDRIADESLASRAPATGFEEFERRGEEARDKPGLEEAGPSPGSGTDKSMYVDIFGGDDKEEAAEALEGGEEEEAAGAFPCAPAGVFI